MVLIALGKHRCHNKACWHQPGLPWLCQRGSRHSQNCLLGGSCWWVPVNSVNSEKAVFVTDPQYLCPYVCWETHNSKVSQNQFSSRSARHSVPMMLYIEENGQHLTSLCWAANFQCKQGRSHPNWMFGKPTSACPTSLAPRIHPPHYPSQIGNYTLPQQH